jgi:murein L,D-transpeptidase YcbB/YkuD
MKFTLIKSLLIAFIFIGLFSCKEKNNVLSSGSSFTSDSLASYLQSQFDKEATFLCRDKLHFLDTLKQFYAARNFKPLWWDALKGDSAAWANLSQTFQHADNHGMDYRYYYFPVIEYYRDDVSQLGSADSAFRYLAELELLVSNGLLELYTDIANGRTDPKEVFGHRYMLPRNNYKKEDYFGWLTSTHLKKGLDAIHAKDETYQRMLKLLQEARDEKAKEKVKSFDYSTYPKLEPGDTGQAVLRIIQRLKAQNLPNASIQRLKDTTLFTRELKQQIEQLQEDYCLQADGTIGFKTYSIIYATATDKINRIKANLERQRWFTKNRSKPFIYVNLAEFKAELHWEDSVKSMKICIGKGLPHNYDELLAYNQKHGWVHKLPRNMQTPQISSSIYYMVINPTWTVPYSIVKNEMWGKMVRDPSYLTRNKYVLQRKGEQRSVDSINWSKASISNFPYTVVQTPGPHNALGLVKYMFHNPFSIYMHDTPNKSAFNRNERDVSHGCVRLEQPILFGEFLMQNSTKYNPDDFRILMGYPPKDKYRRKNYEPGDSTARLKKLTKTTPLHLSKPMPVHMDYRTVSFNGDGDVRYCYDVYHRNKHILREMDKM